MREYIFDRLLKNMGLLVVGGIIGSCITYFFMADGQSISKDISYNVECSQQTCSTGADAAAEQEQCENNNDLKEREQEEESSETPAPQRTENDNPQNKNFHLRYPPLLAKSFSGSERIRAMKTLYEKLDGEFMRCSSFEYFCHVFGYTGNGKRHHPTSGDFIDWMDGKPSLQWLILKLYKPKGEKQIARGTWTKVETCFLLDGMPIPLRSMKLETNHIGKPYKDRIDAVIAEVMQKGTTDEPIHSETFI